MLNSVIHINISAKQSIVCCRLSDMWYIIFGIRGNLLKKMRSSNWINPLDLINIPFKYFFFPLHFTKLLLLHYGDEYTSNPWSIYSHVSGHSTLYIYKIKTYNMRQDNFVGYYTMASWLLYISKEGFWDKSHSHFFPL